MKSQWSKFPLTLTLLNMEVNSLCSGSGQWRSDSLTPPPPTLTHITAGPGRSRTIFFLFSHPSHHYDAQCSQPPRPDHLENTMLSAPMIPLSPELWLQAPLTWLICLHSRPSSDRNHTVSDCALINNLKSPRLLCNPSPGFMQIKNDRSQVFRDRSLFSFFSSSSLESADVTRRQSTWKTF